MEPRPTNDEWLQHLGRAAAESERSWRKTLLLGVFLGWAGIDRLYLGYFWLGMLKLVTFGGFIVWWAIDVALLLLGRVSDAEGGFLRRDS